MSITFRQMKIYELHRLFPPDRRTHIFVNERLDPRTLEHAQADEGRCYWRVLVGGRATPGQKVTREGGGVGWDCGWRGESVCEDRNSSAYTRGEDEKYISLLTVPNKTKTKTKSLLCLLYQTNKRAAASALELFLDFSLTGVRLDGRTTRLGGKDRCIRNNRALYP